MTAMQVLHGCPELGGDTVQEPSQDAPGIYVGMTHNTSRFSLKCSCSQLWTTSISTHRSFAAVIAQLQ